MNTEQLTTLDPNKTYVDYLGRKWKSTDRDCFYCLEANLTVPAHEMPTFYPDLREHVPQWYEPLLEKGPWVVITEGERSSPFIACMGKDGFSLRLHQTADKYTLMCGLWGETVLSSVTLDDCLAAAEPLVWKGVAS